MDEKEAEARPLKGSGIPLPTLSIEILISQSISLLTTSNFVCIKSLYSSK